MRPTAKGATVMDNVPKVVLRVPEGAETNTGGRPHPARDLLFVAAALILAEAAKVGNYQRAAFWPGETVLAAAVRIATNFGEVLVLSLVLWGPARLLGYRGGLRRLLTIPARLCFLFPAMTLLGDLDYLIELSPAARVAAFCAKEVLVGVALGLGLGFLVHALRKRTGFSPARLAGLLALFAVLSVPVALVFSVLGTALGVLGRSVLLS